MALSNIYSAEEIKQYTNLLHKVLTESYILLEAQDNTEPPVDAKGMANLLAFVKCISE